MLRGGKSGPALVPGEAARSRIYQAVVRTQAGVKALVLTHFGAMAPEMLAAIEQDVRRDFGGQLSMGSDLFVLDL